MTPRTPRIHGVVPPVVTPLLPDGQVDTDSLEKLVAFLIDGGVNGLFALGSSGEVAYLTDQQQATVLDVIVGAAGGQVPVLAGVIETTTNKVVERAEAAARQGVDALVATAPFYTRTHATEIDRHFRLISAAVDLPLFAYDIPVCVNNKLDRSLILSLAKDGVLAGVKDSSGDDVAFRRLAIDLKEMPEFALLTGHEVVVDAMLLGGADGSVPGLGNVDPHGYRRLHDAADRGDWVAAKAEQDRLAELFDIVFVADPATSSGTSAGLGAFKTALQVRGIIAHNTVSPPMRRLDEQETRAIAGILDRAGLK
ncbi:dihydrodipicolinate synthase family protein [Streptomyces sp. NBC_01387]|uniref:dihydrodipicolinate synthase family protein n=1 Tax=unclassified Streptomyces TaxID=2593676 RepID=UPI00202412AD|nr:MULTISPECIES: dihydrodipicolinate synthase family protein [unclassified Streptomyces]WSV58002.1 dihydrodipicolinate synthase family protein [Streptomyces sp. NBC_01014]